MAKTRKNPDVGKPARAGAAPRSTTVKTMARGADLVPQDLGSLGGGTEPEFLYWVGVTPSCPVESIDLAGINFPKVNEVLIPNRLQPDKKSRVPSIGAIVRLTDDKLRLMADRLPRTVIRFYGDGDPQAKGKDAEEGTGLNVGDAHVRPRRGQLITIPTAAEIAARKKAGKSTRAYVPKAGDVPAARYMFAQLCANQKDGTRGTEYPDVLETTGLECPDELDLELADLI